MNGPMWQVACLLCWHADKYVKQPAKRIATIMIACAKMPALATEAKQQYKSTARADNNWNLNFWLNLNLCSIVFLQRFATVLPPRCMQDAWLALVCWQEMQISLENIVVKIRKMLVSIVLAATWKGRIAYFWGQEKMEMRAKIDWRSLTSSQNGADVEEVEGADKR